MRTRTIAALAAAVSLVAAAPAAADSIAYIKGGDVWRKLTRRRTVRLSVRVAFKPATATTLRRTAAIKLCRYAGVRG